MVLKHPSEFHEAKSYVAWCMLHPELRDYIIHIPNEGKRSKWNGFGLKLIGMRPGVSDFFIPVPKGMYSGLWIELKKIGAGKPTLMQNIWIKRMIAKGYAAYVAYGWEEAKDYTEEYLNGGTS